MHAFTRRCMVWGMLEFIAGLFGRPVEGCIIPDTVSGHPAVFNAQLTANLLLLNNWNALTERRYGLNARSTYQHTGTRYTLKVEWQLGCTGYADSLFIKDSDEFAVTIMSQQKDKNFATALNSGLTTLLFDRYNYVNDPLTHTVHRTKTGTFGNPLAFELGYGLGYRFWNHSTANLSLASARIRIDNPQTAEAHNWVLARLRTGWVSFDYGLSANWSVDREFTSRIGWSFSGKLFLKGKGPEPFRTDGSQSFRFKLMKNVVLKADLKWVYEPMESLRLQYRNEWSVGLSYDKYQKH